MTVNTLHAGLLSLDSEHWIANNGGQVRHLFGSVAKPPSGCDLECLSMWRREPHYEAQPTILGEVFRDGPIY
ncbi:hypothetical protein THTE_2226 [Thermogutta terrifontis]|uniref:Uncharacterized protein n=1 Tax=Thermogutta terrifontis TaxID=1331910 RepID=A0A286RFT9_9BACT|nr:hypothetical protein THTE_2226 [Thermogutta terrifontis]